MIIEAGHFALNMALICALLQIAMTIGAIFIPSWQKNKPHILLTSGVFGLIFFAFAALLYAFLSSDFSVAIVAQNSHTGLPFLFKSTAIWGNHEGSMLLFVLFLSLFTLLFLLFVFRKTPPQSSSLSVGVLACQHAILAAYLVFILFTSNPFARLDEEITQGSDLNPLLQDIGLVVHPPLLYLGLVGFSLAFSYAVIVLIKGESPTNLGYLIRPWLLISWSFLTLGITLGSYWAYYELGWGGYWFWDPVENASLMPWLSATALIHSCSVLAKRGGLQLWTVLLSILTFSLVLLGTFLVRANLLISVHNFAILAHRFLAILLIVVLFSGGGLLLFALRCHKLETHHQTQILSREGALVFNNIFLSTACATVLVGTIYPLIMEAIWAEKISIGPPFFNIMFCLLVPPLLLILPLGPLLGWQQANIRAVFERLGLAIAASLSVLITCLLLNEEKASLVTLLSAAGFGLACWLIIGAGCDLFYYGKISKGPPMLILRRFVRLPLNIYGRIVAHGSIGVTLAGIIAVTNFSHEIITVMPVGHFVSINDKILRFDAFAPHIANNYLEDRYQFSLWEEKEGTAILLDTIQAARRIFPARNMETSEVGLMRRALSHYYIAAGQLDDKGQLVVHIWYKAGVIAIWLGGLGMAAGGGLAAIGRFPKSSKKFSDFLDISKNCGKQDN